MQRLRKRLLSRIRRKLPWTLGKSDFQIQLELIARAKYIVERMLKEVDPENPLIEVTTEYRPGQRPKHFVNYGTDQEKELN